MPNGKPYILFCAGEDSGDCIGESLLLAASDFLKSNLIVDFVGAGGPRMKNAGLKTLVDYESLPVSGFADVLPKYFSLRKSFNVLKRTLENPLCVGLVAIDYPGFNMKLVRLAGKSNKPSLYVAPPQVWAWKSKRAIQLSKVQGTKLAVFFEFEKLPFEKAGCNVVLLQHPFVQAIMELEKSDFIENLNSACTKKDKQTILLLPGSRESQMLRNVPLFLEIAKRFPQMNFTFVGARESLLLKLKERIGAILDESSKQFNYVVSPSNAKERYKLYQNAMAAICSPGTATLELALSKCPFVVLTKPDFLTFALGKRFVKTNAFSLPNILLNQKYFDEFVQNQWNESDFEMVAGALQNAVENKKDRAEYLRSLLVNNHKNSKQLMSEFLAQFL